MHFLPGVIFIKLRHGSICLPATTEEEFSRSVMWILNHPWFKKWAEEKPSDPPGKPTVLPEDAPPGVARRAVEKEWSGYRAKLADWQEEMVAGQELAKVLQSQDGVAGWKWIKNFELYIPGLESIQQEYFEGPKVQIGYWT